jgi:hypothetical protein
MLAIQQSSTAVLNLIRIMSHFLQDKNDTPLSQVYYYRYPITDSYQAICKFT